jgi:hypothetical protein
MVDADEYGQTKANFNLHENLSPGKSSNVFRSNSKFQKVK